MSTVKRVISHPDEVGRHNPKMSKQSPPPPSPTTKAEATGDENVYMDSAIDDEVLAPAMNSLAIAGSNSKDEEKNKLMSSMDNNNDTFKKFNNEVNSLQKEHQHHSNSSFDKDIPIEKEEGKTDSFVRQVSVDSSTNVPLKVVEVNRLVSSNGSSSVVRNKSDSTVGSSACNAAKDWGWFEDIHDHTSKGNNKSPPSGDKKGSNRKSGGLLLFNDLVNPINDIEPKKKTGKKNLHDEINRISYAPVITFHSVKTQETHSLYLIFLVTICFFSYQFRGWNNDGCDSANLCTRGIYIISKVMEGHSWD